ncbi:signal peptidase II [Chlamydia sp. 17-3921]|uniref:signal peptidase II n=1 Tax=Chlamydia sp. 17-3921 TaxID=2675798 RepID=UPI001917BF66|nr:signal peptidase II [Chlamydia sp. 17-3921]
MASRFKKAILAMVPLITIDWVAKFIVFLGYKSWKGAAHVKLYSYSLGLFSFSIYPTFNEGAAFNFFANYKNFLLVFRLCIILGILSYLFFKNSSTPLTRFALILLCSGAIGNVGDIFFYGHVIDFVALSYRNWAFPTFNLADVFISLGTILLVYKLYFPKQQKTK